MSKFRLKKDVVVDAIQLTREMVLDQEPLPEGVFCMRRSWHPELGIVYYYRYIVQTQEGKKDILVGDWIITYADGTVHLCDPYTFSAAYELVNEK